MTDEQRRGYAETLRGYVDDEALDSGDLRGFLAEAIGLLAAEIKAHEEARRQLDECREVLRAVEWGSWTTELGEEVDACPHCQNERQFGHATGCRLAAVLGGGK